MKKIKLKKSKITPFTYILILILLLIISLIFIFKYIGHNLSDKVESYATKQSKKIITLVINKSIDKELISSFELNQIFTESENTIDFNSVKLNKILLEVNKKLKDNLNKLESGELKLEDETILKNKTKKGIVYEIPTGIIFNNALLANIGPKIPVKLHLIEDVLTGIDTNVIDYGINNAIIEVYIKITINEQVILPFSSKQISVTEKVPIAIKLIEGKVPNYYSSGKDNAVVIDK